MEQIVEILKYMLGSLAHIWPYLLITIPLAVSVKLFGISRLISKALAQDPYVAIILATAVGAISPLCSCGVIPVIASLLIGGVPLAPVMSFWIASPSMDPEIFMLSVAAIGWKLSVWRLAATFLVSLLSGIITHITFSKNHSGYELLRQDASPASWKPARALLTILSDALMRIIAGILPYERTKARTVVMKYITTNDVTANCCIQVENDPPAPPTGNYETHSCDSCDQPDTDNIKVSVNTILNETWNATYMVAKFMLLAFFITALIEFYLPKDLLAGFIGTDNLFSPLLAALVGIPFYTTNVTALPLISGMLALGMDPGAALAFLIAGPVTTLPAMIAVWGVVKPRIFFMYLAFSLSGSVLTGYLYYLLH